MKSIFVILGLTVTLCIVLLSQSSACSFDTDCQPGSKCLKKSGSIYGVCVGGLFPGNANDEEPVYAPTDPSGTYGDTCSFDTDCGPGSVCVKSGGIYGTCMKKGRNLQSQPTPFQDNRRTDKIQVLYPSSEDREDESLEYGNPAYVCHKYPPGYPITVCPGMVTYQDGTVCCPR